MIGIQIILDSCHTFDMEQERTQRNLLDDMVARGVISAEQADDIANAPRWSFSIRELVTLSLIHI